MAITRDTTLEEAWHELVSATPLHTLADEDQRAYRRVFYCGAVALMGCVSRGEDTSALADELKRFQLAAVGCPPVVARVPGIFETAWQTLVKLSSISGEEDDKMELLYHAFHVGAATLSSLLWSGGDAARLSSEALATYHKIDLTRLSSP